MAMHVSVSLLFLLVLLAVTSECDKSHGYPKAPKGEKSHGRPKTTTAAPHSSQTPISILVTNSVTNGPNKKYSTYVVYRGILLGAMRRLQESNVNFDFTYSEDKNYGPFLESVNGLAGNFSERTYWQLKVKKADGTFIIPDVGIGCYIPTANDEIIFNFTTY